VYPDLMPRVTLFHLLHLIDIDLAATCRSAGCPHCGGRLDQAPYPRKPRGEELDLPESYKIRLSLCCSVEGCRRRRLPPSTLFWGRRVHWAPVVLLVVTLRQQRPDGYSASKLRSLFEVSRPTLVRWMAYFRSVFPSSPWWQRLRGRVGVAVADGALPSSLLAAFLAIEGRGEAALVSCLRFLATGQTGPPGAQSLVADLAHAKDGEIP
jgi:hypothetical protein